MKLLSLLFAGLIVSFSPFTLAVDDLVVVKSPRSAPATMDKYEELAKQRGLNLRFPVASQGKSQVQ